MSTQWCYKIITKLLVRLLIASYLAVGAREDSVERQEAANDDEGDADDQSNVHRGWGAPKTVTWKLLKSLFGAVLFTFLEQTRIFLFCLIFKFSLLSIYPLHTSDRMKCNSLLDISSGINVRFVRCLVIRWRFAVFRSRAAVTVWVRISIFSGNKIWKRSTQWNNFHYRVCNE